MLYDWMKKELINDFDTDLILAHDAEEIKKASAVIDKIRKQIALVNNTLLYSYFLRKNLDSIRTNYENMDQITFNVYKILAYCNPTNIRRYISVTSFEKAVSYIRYFKTVSFDDRVDLRVRKLHLPVNPFMDIIKDLKLFAYNTTDRTQVSIVSSLTEKMNRCNEYAAEIEKCAANMIEYDIGDEFSEFDENKLGAYELLLGNLLDMFEQSAEEIETKENSLEELAEELEMVETIVEEYS